MSDDKKEKIYFCFDTDGNILISSFSVFGEREEKVLDKKDVDKYFDYLFVHCNFKKVLDKYNLCFYVKK